MVSSCSLFLLLVYLLMLRSTDFFSSSFFCTWVKLKICSRLDCTQFSVLSQIEWWKQTCFTGIGQISGYLWSRRLSLMAVLYLQYTASWAYSQLWSNLQTWLKWYHDLFICRQSCISEFPPTSSSDVMCCFTVIAMYSVSLWVLLVLRSWKSLHPFSGSTGDWWRWWGGRAFWELFHVLLFYLFIFCLDSQPASQLELVCGALLSHFHLMENICCHAFYYQDSH